MHWTKPATGLVVLATAVLVVGSLAGLVPALDAAGRAATVAVVAIAVVVTALAGSRVRALSTPYW